ncbi:MAG: tRNA 2-thiouridine(34) synthase MnmA [Spirochaetes bacterium]|nr:tRNA 2-thiouridine(34) synthase MnmA [Spirochaetota bacterium]MBU1081859.1 tRNA 2-thiouridine(34) synthase MnmA [Spirochaetota bacterium]
MSCINLRPLAGKRVAVGLSGGVDSSTVLGLLAEAGADVFGLTMRIWRPGAVPVAGIGDACYGPGEGEDVAAAEALCSSLGVPYVSLDLSAEYEALILGYFRREYLAGRTPNPCVRCNQDMKFGFLLERAKEAGLEFELFATGHYARIEERRGVTALRRAADESKDQSYFIHRLGPSTLASVIFPLGGSTKAEVRAEARRLGLAAADKAESQDFIAGGYGALFADQEPGDIVDEGGTVLGRHSGIVNYTIGQRRGLGISTGPEPLYVCALDAGRNRVVVSRDSSLFCSAIEASDAVLHDESLRGGPFDAFVRIRQNHRPAAARVRVDGGRARVEFAEPQRAAAPGQSAVFYDADGFVLGGCVIEGAERPSGGLTR